MRIAPLLIAALAAAPLLAQAPGNVRNVGNVGTVEFEPKVGAIGAQVRLKNPPPPGTEVRLGSRALTILRDASGGVIVVPPGSSTGFIEYVKGGKLVGRSVVPFVVSGTSLVSTPKLVGLREAIDVFGYSESRPEGGEKPENVAKPVLKLDEDAILTLGESPPERLLSATDLGDAASMATRGMGPAGLLFTARPPKKKLPPTPVPQPAP
jgi:hypothetical protein